MNFAICILLAGLASLAVGTPEYGYGDDDDDRYMSYGRRGGRMYGGTMSRGMYGPGMMGRSYGYMNGGDMNGGGYPDMYGGRSMMSYGGGPGMGPMGYGSSYGMTSRYPSYGGGRHRRCRCRKRCKYYERYAGKCRWCRHHYCRIRCCRWYY